MGVYPQRRRPDRRRRCQGQFMAVPGRHGRGDFPSLQLHSAGRSANHRLRWEVTEALSTHRGILSVREREGVQAYMQLQVGLLSNRIQGPLAPKDSPQVSVTSCHFSRKGSTTTPSRPNCSCARLRKDYQSIMHFLFSQLDPNFKFGKKYVDDIPHLFKGLRFFNISKTALSAVGSPHTWPALLASIAWFIEVLTYHDIANASDMEAPISIEAESERAFFAYLKNAYHSALCAG